MYNPNNSFLYHVWTDDDINPPTYLGHVRAWHYHEALIKASETFRIRKIDLMVLREGETSEYFQVPKGVEHETS